MDRKNEFDKLEAVIKYWTVHNKEHLRDYEKWLLKAEELGANELASELKKFLDLTKNADNYIYNCEKILNRMSSKPDADLNKMKSNSSLGADGESLDKENETSIKYKNIGIIKTPYQDNAPYQPVEGDEGEFKLVLFDKYKKGLESLEKFTYIYVLYQTHRMTGEASLMVSPSWAHGVSVGVFASRSPARPNNIGLSVVKIKNIKGNVISVSGLDAFDGTPIIDIKPYIKDLDSKADANLGWLADLDGDDHLLQHIKGIPHDH